MSPRDVPMDAKPYLGRVKAGEKSVQTPVDFEEDIKAIETKNKSAATKAEKRAAAAEAEELDGVRTRTFRVRLYPDKSQRATLRKFFGDARFTYNETVVIVKKQLEANDSTTSKALKDHVKKVLVTNPPDEQKWLKDTPVYCREGAMKDFFTAQKSVFSNRARGHQTGGSFSFKFRSRKDVSSSVLIRGDSIRFVIPPPKDPDKNKPVRRPKVRGTKRTGKKKKKIGNLHHGTNRAFVSLYPTYFGGVPIRMQCNKNLSRLGESAKHDLRMIRTRDDKYWLGVVLDRPEVGGVVSDPTLTDNRAELAVLDPGVRTFHTAYGVDGHVLDIGTTDDVSRLCRIGFYIDKNKSRIAALQSQIAKREKALKAKLGDKDGDVKMVDQTNRKDGGVVDSRLRALRNKERRWENKNLTLWRRARHLVDEIHWKAIGQPQEFRCAFASICPEWTADLFDSS